MTGRATSVFPGPSGPPGNQTPAVSSVRPNPDAKAYRCRTEHGMRDCKVGPTLVVEIGLLAKLAL
jgi:hypothetical protein